MMKRLQISPQNHSLIRSGYVLSFFGIKATLTFFRSFGHDMDGLFFKMW